MTHVFLKRTLSSGFSLIFYAMVAFLLFGIRLYPDFYHQYLGTGTDPKGVIWIMSYWQNCIHHFSDFFMNDMSWAPFKFNLTQTQPMMLVGLLNKVFSIKNPIFAMNFWLSMSLILSAWSAFFLCWYVSKSYWASLIGGYLYGFSSYMIAQLMAHLVCILMFFVPVIILLYLLLFNQEINRWVFLLLFSLINAMQFYLYVEPVVILGFFGTITLIFSVSRWGEVKEKVLTTLPWLVSGYFISLLLVLPYLYYFFLSSGHGFSKDIVWNSIDLINFVVPTPVTELGGSLFYFFSKHYPTNLFEGGGYVGIGCVLIVAAFLKEFRYHLAYKIIVFCLLLTFIASLGPYLHVGGNRIFILPWMIFGHLPILDYLLPARFSAYLFLVLAVMLSLWLSQSKRSEFKKYLLTIFSLTLLLPTFKNFQYKGEWEQWVTIINVPSYIKGNLYQRYIAPGSHVLELPMNNDVCVHQAMANMYYKLVTGCVDGNPYGDRYHDLFNFFATGGSVTKNIEKEFFSFSKEAKVDTIIFEKDSYFDKISFLNQSGKTVYQDHQYKIISVTRKF